MNCPPCSAGLWGRDKRPVDERLRLERDGGAQEWSGEREAGNDAEIAIVDLVEPACLDDGNCDIGILFC